MEDERAEEEEMRERERERECDNGPETNRILARGDTKRDRNFLLTESLLRNFIAVCVVMRRGSSVYETCVAARYVGRSAREHVICVIRVSLSENREYDIAYCSRNGA